MKKLTPEELPEILTDDIIEILAHMANQFPITKEWRKIASNLSESQRTLVNNKICEIQDLEVSKRKASMTTEEKEEQRLKRERMLEELERDPHTFFGNMGQPETLEEFKNRYGVYPWLAQAKPKNT